MDTDSTLPRIVITSGEPAGIGPDILLQTLQQTFNAEIIVIADPGLLEERAARLQLSVDITEFDYSAPTTAHKAKQVKIIPLQLIEACIPGKLDKRNADYVLKTLEMSCHGCLQHDFSAMVTAPVNKAIINEAGIKFSGHTEFIADKCKIETPVMMLANENLRIALVTTHIPLSEVCKNITRERVEKVLKIVNHDLVHKFGIKHPRIAVCGLNPHAGEGGFLGNEEIKTIIPVIEKLTDQGMDIAGPLSADTAFTSEQAEQFDVIVTMYHDQGLPVIKSSGFGEIVNITLGLPIIRTSVDHGTALHLAGTGKTRYTSLVFAIKSAIDLCNYSRRSTTQNVFPQPVPVVK